MAQQTKSTLKNWFMTGLKPLQQHFHDWMDSYFHKGESIPQSAIDGLEAALNNVPNNQSVNNLIISVYGETQTFVDQETFELKAGEVLDRVVITSGTTQNVKIESNPSAEDVVPYTNISQNTSQLFRCDLLAPTGGLTLTITCTDPIQVKIWVQ